MALGGGVAATEEGINDRVKLCMHRCIMSRSKSMGGVRQNKVREEQTNQKNQSYAFIHRVMDD